MVAFRCYSSFGAAGPHDDAWRAALPPEFNGDVDGQLEVLQQHKTLEDKRYFKELRGRCEGLTEIRIEFELELDDLRSRHENTGPPKKRSKRPKIVIRILGFGNAKGFVLLYAFRKRGEPDYAPACHAALNRQNGVARDGRRARPCSFP
jgi:hypothetical protein